MTMPNQTANTIRPQKRSTLIIVFLVLFALCSVLGAFTPAARALIVLYPAGAFFLAIWAYQRWKPGYIGLVCWLWFFSPCLRRVVEYRAGGVGTPILLASFLASSVPAMFLAASWSDLINKRTAPIFYMLGGVAYGSVIALSHFRFVGLAAALLAWISPIIFAFFLYKEREQYVSLYGSLEAAFLSATILSGLYGIYQFLFLAQWDAFWMLNADVVSFGQAEPWQVRVFGTMNSPQVFASFLVCGIIISFKSQNKLRFLAAPLGLAALILTMSRSGWLSLVAGTIYLCFYLTNRQRVQLAGVVFACGVLVAGSLQNSEINEVVTKRFQSLSSGKSDDSVGARLLDYGTLMQLMSNQPFGTGLGDDSDDGAQKTSAAGSGGIQSRDSTITSVLLSLGWIGSAAFALGIFIVCVEIFAGARPADDALVPVRAVLIGLIAESPLNNISAGPTAFVVWICIGICLAQSEVVSEATSRVTATLRQSLGRSPATAG